MKTSFIISLVIVLSFNAFCQTKTSIKPRLDIFYFHATNRCPTCISIEDNTKKVLVKYFKKEVNAGTIKMAVMDCEDEKYKLLADKYGAVGSTLILQSNVGKQEKENMTNFAFSYSRNNPDKFMSGLKDKITLLMK